MPITHSLLVHTGRVLWPEHRSEAQVTALKATTPPHIFESTYQGRPSAPGGVVFDRAWWAGGRNRYHLADPALARQVIGRYISVDSALKEDESNDWSVLCVGELLADYRLRVRHVRRERLALPALHQAIVDEIGAWNHDRLLRGVVIEDKASGTSVLQTLREVSDPGIRQLLVAFQPRLAKEVRARQVSIYCSADCILLPHPDPAVPWLADFEKEVGNFPGDRHDDQVDALTQLLLYVEHLLSAGLHARRGLMTVSAPAAPPPTDRIATAFAASVPAAALRGARGRR